MTQRNDIRPLEILHNNCCGIDIHKDTAVACINYVDKITGEIKEEIKTFSCFTDDLYKLRDWLIDRECDIVSIESTGVYWRPVHNVLENEVEVLLVNARHYQNVPGRKTDVNDSQWLCNLLKYGLLKGSFIPSAEVREWRELTRLRRQLTKDVGNYKRQVHKVFQTANIKIDSVVSDLFCMTGCNLMDLLCSGQEITLAGVESCALGSLRGKVDELFRSIKGFFKEHHRYQIQLLRDLIRGVEKQIASLSQRINQLMTNHEELQKRLMEIPGIDVKSAQVILGEIGVDLTAFKTDVALASWAGVAPGNHESAGKKYSGKSPVRKHVFKESLVQMAWAAVKKKNSFWKDKYYRLKVRRGAKRAIVAIAHKMLKVIYRIIKQGESYREINQEETEKQQQKKMKQLKKQAQLLGYDLIAAASI